jgi:hypothetical protein
VNSDIDYQFPPKNIKEGIYAAICFFDIFDLALNYDEIKRYKMGPQCSDDKLKEILNHDPLVESKNGLFFIKGRDGLVKRKDEKLLVAEKFWLKVKKYLPFIRSVPFIKMVAVCNTLAFNAPSAESDIDLFIIAEEGRIFTVRFLSTILFHLLGVRRHGNKIAGRFCLSFYISNDAMNLEKIKNGGKDVYLPYWLATLKVVYGREGYEKLMRSNVWMNQYFPMDDSGKNQNLSEKDKMIRGKSLLVLWAKILEYILKGRIGDFLEKFIRNFQLKRHNRKKPALGHEASVIVNDSMLKYHNVDRRKEFARKFMERYLKMLRSA